MDLRKYSAGNYLKSEDVKTTAKMWTIISSEERMLPDGNKPILVLETLTPKDGRVTKDFTVNVTNINRLDECFGTLETDDMVGRKLLLVVEKVDFKGKNVDGVRVDVEGTKSINKER